MDLEYRVQLNIWGDSVQIDRDRRPGAVVVAVVAVIVVVVVVVLVVVVVVTQ